MELSINDIISLLIAFLSVLFALYLLTAKTENYISNLLIALFLIVSVQDSAAQYVGMFVYPEYPGWGLFISSVIFFEAPLLFLFILSVIYSDLKLKPKHLLHIIPFILINLVYTPRFYALGFEEKIQFLEVNSVQKMPEIIFSYLLVHAQTLGYLIAGFGAVRKSRKLLLENYSSPNMINHNWLYQLLLLFGIQFILGSVKNIFLFWHIEAPYQFAVILTSVLTLAIICWIVLKALHTPELFRGVDSGLQLVKNMAKNDLPAQAEERFNHLDKETRVKIEKLKTLMSSEEPYLDASLNIRKLAKLMNLPPRDLSILINHHLGQHFFDFINEYRIQKAEELLKKSDSERSTVLEILYAVGFNSKSSFNTIFKKRTGLTPTEYRKKYSS